MTISYLQVIYISIMYFNHIAVSKMLLCQTYI